MSRAVMHAILYIFVGLNVVNCSSQSLGAASPVDEFQWLEEVQGAKPLAWVKEQNQISQTAIEGLPTYKRNEREIKRILLATDRLPYINQMGNYVYNFWQDDIHVRGLWRRTTLKSYAKRSPKWEVVLDLDKLARAENENWIFKGANCLPPRYEQCLLILSRGGKDASVTREFNTMTKAFVLNGFIVPEGKNYLAWVNQDTVLVAANMGLDSVTTSGYPRTAMVWPRGSALTQAKKLFEAKKEDVGIFLSAIHTANGHLALVTREITAFENETFAYTSDGSFNKIHKPLDAQYSNWLNGQHILLLRSAWTVRGEKFLSGSLVALPPIENAQPKLIFTPNEKQAIGSVEQSKEALIINYLDTVQSKVARAYPKGDSWVLENLSFPDKGDIRLLSVDGFGDLLLASFQNFLIPNSVMSAHVGLDHSADAIQPRVLKSLPARFDSRQFKVEQLWSTSKDGTQVPYFFISDKKLKADGKTPVLIYGYGGFEISQSPYYPAVLGKVWLERGGAYVLANIRGGGEFGPQWHQAALKEKRQNAFDDFIGVAEDLVKRNISSPMKMAISGGSNGGLLVGATFVQRPDLFKAVICKVPLLDMLRYNKLLAGASWQGEYGNPDDPDMYRAILKYSPYQNVHGGVKYPEVFFLTSTMDDRVHPGHARKMVAKMRAQGHPLMYYENTEGGHSAAANLLQRVKSATLEYTFLQDRLLKN